MNYSDLNLSVQPDNKSINFLGNDIEVKQYLPAQDKYDLINVTLQEAYVENGIYSAFKANMYFHLNLVYMYSNLEFSTEDREDEGKLYDVLETTGLMGEIISAIPESEYNYLLEYISNEMKNRMEFGTRIGTSITKAIEELPGAMETAMSTLKDFNPEDFQNVINFVNAANGNRDFRTNAPIES